MEELVGREPLDLAEGGSRPDVVHIGAHLSVQGTEKSRRGEATHDLVGGDGRRQSLGRYHDSNENRDTG